MASVPDKPPHTCTAIADRPWFPPLVSPKPVAVRYRAITSLRDTMVLPAFIVQ